MNYKIDHGRAKRIGFPEVIYGESKDSETIKRIASEIMEKFGKVLITKLQRDKFEDLAQKFSDIFYDEVSCICIIGKIVKSKKKYPQVSILSGGTSDEFVVNEAFYTLSFLGVKAERIIDVGVAGIHRLMEKQDLIKKADILIVCAGFEGALPTVVGGLFPQPIIGVPISIGYGVADGGFTALNAMLSSCANGLTVTNIDNGYGAAIAAYRILNRNKK